MAVDNKLGWLAGFEFSSLFGYLIAVLFCLVLGYRVWDKYGRGRPKKTLLEQEAERVKRAAEAGLIQATQTEPQLNQQPQQEAEAAHELHEPHETQEPRPNAVPVQLDLLGFSTKQKWSLYEYKQLFNAYNNHCQHKIECKQKTSHEPILSNPPRISSASPN